MKKEEFNYDQMLNTWVNVLGNHKKGFDYIWKCLMSNNNKTKQPILYRGSMDINTMGGRG